MSKQQAVQLIKNGDVVATGGFIGSGIAEEILSEMEQNFLQNGYPRDLTVIFPAGQGARDGSGNDHFSHEGLLKTVIGGHWAKCPRMGELANKNKIQAYNIPQGVISQMFRDIAVKTGFTLSKVGLHTFVDPRVEGGRLNRVTTENIVKVVEIEGQEFLMYKHFPIDVCILRGTYADESGNISMEHEAMTLDATSIAQACKASGGKVIVQVKQIVKKGSLDPKLVKIPGIYVDAIVVAGQSHEQCMGTYYDPSISGQTRCSMEQEVAGELDNKKVIGRRAAMELQKGAVINLGIGAPEYISKVAVEEGISDDLTLTIESGIVGGVALSGNQFGAAKNPEAILDQRLQFDFYDGGGIDLAFLGLAEADQQGNVNVSKFGDFVAGCGGFINITQNAKKVMFCGTFTAGGLRTSIDEGILTIEQEGSKKKFVKTVEQITFSGSYAGEREQPVMFITERAVFTLEKDGLHLKEIAPGVDLEKDILAQMDFKPVIDDDLKLMPENIFKKEKMGLC